LREQNTKKYKNMKTDQLYFRFGQSESEKRAAEKIANLYREHQDPSSKCLTEELSPSASFRQLCPVLVSLQEIWQDCHN
jgi:hypothetical protein